MTTSFRFVKHFKDAEPNVPPETWSTVRDALERQQGITYFKMFYLPAIQEAVDKEPLFPIR